MIYKRVVDRHEVNRRYATTLRRFLNLNDMPVYSPTKTGYYWVVLKHKLNDEPSIAYLFDDTDSNWVTPGIHLVWGIILWERNCDYEEYVSLHPDPLEPKKLIFEK